MNNQKDTTAELTLKEVLQEEQKLQFPEFSNELACRIGLSAVQKVKERHLKPIGVRIVFRGLLIFQYLMDGKKEDSWLKRKEQTVYATGHSGLCVFLTADDYPRLQNDDRYAVCGGSFPIRMGGELCGAICFSGLPHTEDHRLITEVLKEVLQ